MDIKWQEVWENIQEKGEKVIQALGQQEMNRGMTRAGLEAGKQQIPEISVQNAVEARPKQNTNNNTLKNK